MKKIQYAIARRETGNASGKAKKDAYETALKLGFHPNYHPSSNQKIRVIQQILTVHRFKGEKVIFFQYPAVSEQLMNIFKRKVTSSSYKIALVHDLSSIQGIENYEKVRESNYLSIFDCLIVHNNRMKDYVERIGFNGRIVVLDLFDYLHDSKREIQYKPFSNTVTFAGNLEKAKFLQDIGNVNCKWILYGAKGEVDFDDIRNVTYKGLLPSDEIQYLMEGDYGLVWDGDSIDTCSGPNGEYLRFNNPHKLSCYIAAGKPIITWKKAAISDFILKNNIGIVVESLEELNNIDLKDGYDEMKSNVMKLKKEIADGMFLERAIKRALELGEVK